MVNFMGKGVNDLGRLHEVWTVFLVRCYPIVNLG